MANPRQRRKARSSTHKAVQHSKHAKRNLKKTPPIRGPKALQEAWDNRATVKQNYARLGLIHDLNPSAAGGSEKIISPCYDQEALAVDPSQNELSSSSTAVPSGYGRIIRDESGNVIGVELSEDDPDNGQVEEVEVEATMEALEAEIEEGIMYKWASRLGQKNNPSGKKAPQLLEELQSIAMAKKIDSTTLSVAQSSTGPNVRHPAVGEIAYLSRLVAKHSEDVESMAKDRRLNPDQKTEGQLRRALRNAGLLGST